MNFYCIKIIMKYYNLICYLIFLLSTIYCFPFHYFDCITFFSFILYILLFFFLYMGFISLYISIFIILNLYFHFKFANFLFALRWRFCSQTFAYLKHLSSISFFSIILFHILWLCKIKIFNITIHLN